MSASNTKSPWIVAGASARGVSHRKKGTACQDAFAWERLDCDWAVLAVADGAGSAELSDIGAKLAVHTAIAGVRKQLIAARLVGSLTEDIMREALRKCACEAREAVIRAAEYVGRCPRELASTLIVVIAGATVTAALHIGDGAVVIQTADGKIHALSKPDTDEFMGETTFLVGSDSIPRARIGIGPAADSIALFSDGIQLLALQYPSWEPFDTFFRQTFAFMNEHGKAGAASEIEAFLSSEKLAARTDDDVTLLLAFREKPVSATLAPAPTCVEVVA